MSSGIGFAGLGKYLNDKGISLLRGRKKREAENKKIDLRNSESNDTDYNELIKFQQNQREKSWKLRIRIVAFLAFTLLISILLLINLV